MKIIISVFVVLLIIKATIVIVVKGGSKQRYKNPRTDDDRYMHPADYVSNKLKDFEINPEEYTSDYWFKQGQDTITAKMKNLNTNIAKNVIMFLGDGMSIATLKAARVLMGQMDGKDGEGSQLAMEKFPYSGFSKTYCLESQVADSACSSTAYLCGVKAHYGTIGVNGKVNRKNCTASLIESNKIDSIATWSQAKGKRTGIVTTTRVTHASPAGTYAHIAERDWETDYDNEDEACSDIAYQLIHENPGRNFNVILGGGRRGFFAKKRKDQEGHKGRRRDGKDLIEDWLESKKSFNASYVYNKTNLLEIAEKNDYLLGLFDPSHMEYQLDATDEDPTLEEMTEAAIKVLSKGENGYFLFVEGGKIDMAHHGTKPKKSLIETIEFSKAIQKARDVTDENDTLILVTSDHSHVFTVSGYAERGENILGIAGNGKDKIPYTILSYANGPGYRREEDGDRYDMSQQDFDHKDLQYPALVPKSSETHGGEDVGIFASGPWAHLFSGVIEQSVIPYIMAYASCVGQGATACN